MIVHFPIALLTVSFLFDVSGIAFRREGIHKTAWWMLLCGIVGLAGAIATGLLAEHSITIPADVKGHFETHEEMAFVAGALYAVVFYWRVSSKTELPAKNRYLYVLLTLAALTAVWIGAWYGGELVYSSGVGVKVNSVGITP